jgi:hypothetical protein
MFRLFLVLIVSFTLTCSHAEETLVKSQIVSIGLFKNGLAVVRRTVPIQGTGVYRLEDVPNPVHGTFWIESQNAKVVTRVTSRTRRSRTRQPANSRKNWWAGREGSPRLMGKW